MNFLRSNGIALVAVVLAIIAIAGIGAHSAVVNKLGSQVQNDLFQFTGTPVAVQATGITYAQGGLTEGGVTTFNANPITGPLATTTLTLNSLQSGSTVIVNVASSTSQTVNVPGTSTLSVAAGYLVNIGDEETTYVDAASTTAGGLTLNSGAGVTLRYATTTNSGINAAITAGSVFSLSMIRDTANTLIGLVTIFK